MSLIVFACILFFFSGAFALVYQLAWVRMLTLEFGSTTLAVSTVVAIFMGGLALGAMIAGRRASNISRPLRWYGFVEISLAAFVLVSPLLFNLFLPLFSFFGTGIVENIWLLSALRALLSAVCLIVPTALMGATLPLLTHLVRNKQEIAARGPGMLYGVNTIGACVGCFVAGFYLLPAFGVKTCLFITAGANLLLGIIAVSRDRRLENTDDAVASDRKQSKFQASASSGAILAAVALTGFAALTCEIAWTRVVVMIVGASHYAFSTVLTVFLVGLGLGSYLAALLLVRRKSNPNTLFIVFAIAAGILVFISSGLFQEIPQLFINIFDRQLSAKLYGIFWMQLVVSGAVMFVPVVVMGALFPLALHAFSDGAGNIAANTGKLYAYNTVAAIVGSGFAGFVGIPLLGIHHTIILAAGLQCAAGLVLAISIEPRRTRLAFVAAIAMIFVWLGPSRWHPQLMASGLSVYANKYKRKTYESFEDYLKEQEKLLYYRDGLTATVTVTQSLKSKNRDLFISTNGKIDGSSHFDMPTQRLSAHLPLLLHPNPKTMAVVGMGTGTTGGTAALYPLDKVTILEIEPAMVEGAKLFAAHNEAVHDQQNVDIKITDGRLYLQIRPNTFDVISSEPSNPWLAGTANLFTEEYFNNGARALKKDGIFLQWIQIYNLQPKQIRTVLRTFRSAFPHVALTVAEPGADLLMVGSMEPINIDPKFIAEKMREPAVKASLADPRVGIETVAQLLSRFWMMKEQVDQYAGVGPLHTDDLPVIAYQAPLTLYHSTRRRNMDLLADHSVNIFDYLDTSGMTRAERGSLRESLRSAYKVFVPDRLPYFYNSPTEP